MASWAFVISCVLIGLASCTPVPDAPLGDNGGYHYPKPHAHPVPHSHSIPHHHPLPAHLPEPIPYYPSHHVAQPHTVVVHHYHQKFIGVPVIKKVIIDGPHYPLVGGHHAEGHHHHHGGHINGHVQEAHAHVEVAHAHGSHSHGAHGNGYHYPAPAQSNGWS